MKVPSGKTVYHKGKTYKAGEELPADFKLKANDEKKKPEIKPSFGEKKDGFTPGS